MYIKIVYSNGFLGCEEEHYLEVKNVEEAQAQFNSDIEFYGFFWPDNRFVDNDEDEEELESYQQDVYENSYWEEITKEEYEENI